MTIEMTRLGALEISDAQLEAAAQRTHIGPTQLQGPLCHMIGDDVLEASALSTNTTEVGCFTMRAPCRRIEDGAVEEAARPSAGPTQINAPFCHH
jgi:hypothetical protein